MEKPMIRHHNVETDEIIDRQMTDEEFAILQEHRAEEAIKMAEIEEKAQAKAALLERLGLTESEANLLLS